MSKVVQLNGEDLPTPNEPDEEVIKKLESALERAKSGEVHGIVLIETFHDFNTTFLTSGFVCGYSAIGAMQVASTHLANRSLENGS